MVVKAKRAKRHHGKKGQAFWLLDKGLSVGEMRQAVGLDYKTGDVYWRLWRKERGRDGQE